MFILKRRRLFSPAVHTKSGIAWTPASLPGLVAWYKADVGVYKDLGVTPAGNGDNVVQWNDQSGNGYHQLMTDDPANGHQPSYNLSGYNGKRAVMFAAASNQQMVASGIALGSGSAFSAFAVCQMTSNSNSNGRVLAYSAPGNVDYVTGGGVLISRNDANQQAQTYRSGTSAIQNVTYSTNMHIGFVGDGTNTTPYLNNVAGTPVADSNAFTNGGALAVGGAVSSDISQFNSNWDGPIAEIVLTNAAMSSGDRALLEAYFSARW